MLTVADAERRRRQQRHELLFPRRGAAVLRRRYCVEARDLAANDFKYWELMRRGCERGLRVFDLRPQQARHRLVRFKQNWGFDAVPLALRISLCAA